MAAARADLPPPDGSKFVDYEFAVEGLSAGPDHVLLAYPYSASNGRPTVEHAQVTAGAALSVGRRSAAVKLYTMKRADYDAWKAGYEPPEGRDEDPELEKLFTSAKVSRCNLAPQPTFVLPKSDPRSAIRETLKLTSASPCTLVAITSPVGVAPPAVDTSTTDTPAADVTPTRDPASSSPASPPSDTPKRAGCGSCVVGGRSEPAPAPAVVAALVALALLRRRSAAR